jgi:hypothetical protein
VANKCTVPNLRWSQWTPSPHDLGEVRAPSQCQPSIHAHDGVANLGWPVCTSATWAPPSAGRRLVQRTLPKGMGKGACRSPSSGTKPPWSVMSVFSRECARWPPHLGSWCGTSHKMEASGVKVRPAGLRLAPLVTRQRGEVISHQ